MKYLIIAIATILMSGCIGEEADDGCCTYCPEGFSPCGDGCLLDELRSTCPDEMRCFLGCACLANGSHPSQICTCDQVPNRPDCR